MTPTIALRGLTKRYGTVTAVDGLDLTIRPGEVVALLETGARTRAEAVRLADAEGWL